MEPSEQSGPDSESQDVNPVFLQQLRELDIPEEAAKQALLHTRNVSAEEAAMYYFNKLENEEEGDDDLMFKMVFVVNMDLAMGVGKISCFIFIIMIRRNPSWSWEKIRSGSPGWSCCCRFVPGSTGEEQLEGNGLEVGPQWSQEGGSPGHQRGSSTGAAGPGHEPQPAHLPGPRCRAYPGGGWVPHCSCHHGGGGDGEQCHWESEDALRGSNPQWRGRALQCQSATSRGQKFPATGRALACKCVTTFKKDLNNKGKQDVPSPENKHYQPFVSLSFFV
ncbi:UBA_like_SF and PTH2 domain-containing protein isoform X2 [Xiphias gladius]|nr:UBA_like_SF and PTH2 domain-containing protein isoform X2 [Xiphias gladius]XP_039979177.1 UBA_like_SF and PTH2 domain-containing protein isoform X2 [Xiphias gladius]